MGSTIALAEAARVESTFLPAGWEIKVVGSAADLDAPAVGAQLIAADETTGEVTAIVGVTGIVDHVNDLIEPGAYKDTLVKRRPKVCWAHSWEMPIGGVRRIQEWMPGDPRFAQVGATLDGKAWPAEAGALVAHMQMNLKSEKGREAFSAVEFYSKTGECEWSIGWQPIPSKTLRRKDGVRVCKAVELYELSPVLFGAAPLTRTLEVKSLNLASATPRGVAPRVGQPAGTPEGMPEAEAPLNEAAPQPGEADVTDEATLHRDAMGEIDWAEVDAAADTSSAPAAPGTPAVAADPGEVPAEGADEEDLEGAPTEVDDEEPIDADVEDDEGEDEEPVTAQDDDSEDDDSEDDDEDEDDDQPAFLKGKKKKDGQVAISAKALAAFTDGLDFTALTGVVLPEVKAEGGADRNRGGAEQLRRWYVEGEGAARIAWGTPGDFSRCVTIAGKHMGERAKGYCNLRHKDALGIYPAEHAAQERDGVAGKAFAAADRLAKSWNPLLEVGAYAAHDGVERKFMAEGIDGLKGSYEQRQEALRRGIEPLLRDEIGWKRPDRSKYGDNEPMPGDDCWVNIDGTWPDRVVATVVRYGEERAKHTFVVPYSFDGDEPKFGKPQPVELQVSIVPTLDSGKLTDDADDLFAAVVAEDQGLDDALIMPAISLLGSGMGAMKAALIRSPEVKAGRVLSEANASRLRGALEHLLEVARAAGIDLPGWTGPDELGVDDETLPDTTAPAGGVTPVAGRGAPTAVKSLSPADVQAQLAELSNFLS